MEGSGKTRWARPALLVLMGAYFILFLALEYNRYLHFQLYVLNDTAANLQTVWSMIHPPVFTATVQEYLNPVPHNVLGDQLYFTLALYLPFWLIFRTPFVFVVVTVAAMAAAAAPLFGYARQKGLSEGTALFVAGAFLFNPLCFCVYYYFGFRPEALMIAFLLAAWYYLERKKYLAAEMFLLLVLLTKHDGVILLAGLGLYLVVCRPGARKFGALNVAVGALYYFAVVRPLFEAFAYSPTAHFKTLAPWGDTAGQALFNLLLHPGLIIGQISMAEFDYIFLVLGTVGFLCLLSPLFLIALPFMVINLLGNDYYSLICGWHWAPVAPLLYLAGVDGLARAKEALTSPGWRRLAVAAGVVIICGEGIATSRFALEHRKSAADVRDAVRALAVIGPEASVSTNYRFLWLLAFRRQVYFNSNRMHLDVDYVVLARHLIYPEIEQVMDRALIRELQNPKSPLYTDFKPVVSNSEITILKRKQPLPGSQAAGNRP